MRNLALMQTELPALASWQRLADAVRTGGSVFEDVNGIGPWESLSANPEQEAIFNASMARRGANQVAAILATQDLSSVDLVVDVGGGRGAMLAGLLTASPGMRGIVADRADVAAEAQTYLSDPGLGDRARGEATDFFASVPGGGDVYVVANVLHDWADGEAVRILRTIGAAMGARRGSGSSSTSSTPRTGTSSSCATSTSSTCTCWSCSALGSVRLPSTTPSCSPAASAPACSPRRATDGMSSGLGPSP